MPITFPITDLLSSGKILTTSFRLTPRQSYSRTAGGQAIAYDFGVAVWKASYETMKMTWDDCIDFEARLHSLEGAAGSFYGWDTRRIYPKNYPTGSFTDSGLVSSKNGDGKSLGINTLPAGFVVTRGDYMQLTVGGVPRLHQAAESRTANGSGVLGSTTFEPHWDPSISVSDAVKFSNPACLMRLEPGSVQYSDQGKALGSITFSAFQA